MKRLIPVILLLVHQTLWAISADSLELALQTAQGRVKVDLLNRAYRQYRSEDPFKALTFTNEALEIAEEIEYQQGIAQSKNNLGVYYRNLGEYQKSADYLKEALEIISQYDDAMATIASLDDLATSLSLSDQQEESEEAYQQALLMSQESGLRDQQIMILNNWGNMYLDQGLEEKALLTYHKAEKALQVLGTIRYGSEVHSNLGNVYLGKKEFDLAIQHFRSALALDIESNDLYQQANSLLNVGNCQLMMGQLDEAFTSLDRAAQLSKQLQKPSQTARIYTSLAEVYFARNQPILAYLLLKRHNAIRDSLATIETNDKVARVQALFQLDEARLKRMDQQIVTLQGENEKVEFVLVLMIAIVIVSIFIGVYRNQIGKKNVRA